ncbi:MAG: transporter [Vicinamibacterales bacterium]
MRLTRCLYAILAVLALARPAAAQQRPLVTEDPESIGAGRVLLESGLDILNGQRFPVSGLKGNLWKFPTIGISVGISSIAEIQIDGGLHNRLNITDRDSSAPLASAVTATGDTTTDFDDIVIGTKIRLVSEGAERPAFGFRFATKLPNASNESGLGTDTTDFYASILAGKTVQSIRIVANVGLGILADPTQGARQNDVFTYGFSFARAVTQAAEVVGELNGHASTRTGGGFPGTESRSVMRFGGRYTHGPFRADMGVSLGLTTTSPSLGFTAGFTYVFTAFTLP